MNENAKHLVAYDLFPELTHNEIVGWEFPPDIHTVVLLLRDIKEDFNIAQHIDTTKKLFNANELIEIISEGEDLLERIFYLIYLLEKLFAFSRVVKSPTRNRNQVPCPVISAISTKVL